MTAPVEREMTDAEMLLYMDGILNRGSTDLADYLRDWLARLVRSVKDLEAITN
jgi:hypothetical protein